jgi:hypothetical protein
MMSTDHKHPCLKRDLNPRSQRPSNQGLAIGLGLERILAPWNHSVDNRNDSNAKEFTIHTFETTVLKQCFSNCGPRRSAGDFERKNIAKIVSDTLRMKNYKYSELKTGPSEHMNGYSGHIANP